MMLYLPKFPVTSVGSLPRSAELRSLRVKSIKNSSYLKEWEAEVKRHTEYWIRVQEQIGVDLLVSGEFYYHPTDDMTYPALHMKGVELSDEWTYCFRNRMYKPPVVIQKPEYKENITVKWQDFAQSLTDKPVKLIIIGAYSLMDWSLIADPKLSREDVALSYAKVLKEEINNLAETARKRNKPVVIQIDEPASTRRLDEMDLVKHVTEIEIQDLKDAYIIQHQSCFSESLDPISVFSQEAVKGNLKVPVKQHDLELRRGNYRIIDAFRDLPKDKHIGVGLVSVHDRNLESYEEVLAAAEKSYQLFGNRFMLKPDCGLKVIDQDPKISDKASKDKLELLVKVAKELRQKYGSEEIDFMNI